MKVRHAMLVMLMAAVCFYGSKASGQCAACRDATAGSAPIARAGLRRAIPILGIPALLVFSGILVFAFRNEHKFVEQKHQAEPLGPDPVAPE